MPGAETRHVMVPVPVEVVGEVERMLTWGAMMRREVREVEPAAVRRLLELLDGFQQRVLVEVAMAEDEQDPQPLRTMATRVGSTARELLGSMIEINDHWRDAWTGEENAPLLLVLHKIGSQDAALEERTALRVAPLMVGPVLDATGRGRRNRDDLNESF